VGSQQRRQSRDLTADINQKASSRQPATLGARRLVHGKQWRSARASRSPLRTSAGQGAAARTAPDRLTLQSGTDAAPIVVKARFSADLDLDMAALGEQLVLAWSDHPAARTACFRRP